MYKYDFVNKHDVLNKLYLIRYQIKIILRVCICMAFFFNLKLSFFYTPSECGVRLHESKYSTGNFPLWESLEIFAFKKCRR